MQYLNIIYFLIISGVGYKYLRSDGKVLQGVSNPAIQFHYSGVEIFWCLTFATGILAFSLNVGMDLMAIRLLVLEILCIIGLGISTHKAVMSGPLKIYCAFLIWIVIGLFYSPSAPYGIRTILKYIYPLLLCLFASSAVRDSEVFLKSSLLARLIGGISTIQVFIPWCVYIIPGVFWYQTASAIHYISLMILSIGLVFFTKDKQKNLFWAVLFAIPLFIWTLRTSLMGSAVALMAFSLIRYRIKSLPIIFVIFVLGVMSVFFIPSIKDKMFFDSSVTIEDFKEGKIDEDNINTNTRSKMWEILETRFFEESQTVGSGTGAVQGYMYTNPKVFGGLMVPHSDFVQQKCDNGLIGLYLYGAMILFVFIDCFRTYWNRDYEGNAALRLCALVAGASLIGVYATFYSDNVVNYSMATLSMPFGFYGMMLGMRAAHNGDD